MLARAGLPRGPHADAFAARVRDRVCNRDHARGYAADNADAAAAKTGARPGARLRRALAVVTGILLLCGLAPAVPAAAAIPAVATAAAAPPSGAATPSGQNLMYPRVIRLANSGTANER